MKATLPIETAPRDGRTIVLVLKDAHGFEYPFHGRWRDRWVGPNGYAIAPKVVGWRTQ